MICLSYLKNSILIIIKIIQNQCFLKNFFASSPSFKIPQTQVVFKDFTPPKDLATAPQP